VDEKNIPQLGTAVARDAKIAKHRRNWKTLPLITLMTRISGEIADIAVIARDRKGKTRRIEAMCSNAPVSLLALIHHGQEFAMQLFPRNRYCFSRLQVFYPTRYFFVPSIFDGFIFPHSSAISLMIGAGILKLDRDLAGKNGRLGRGQRS
jgi:hypothetical protein